MYKQLAFLILMQSYNEKKMSFLFEKLSTMIMSSCKLFIGLGVHGEQYIFAYSPVDCLL